jgi:hypothetical protein
MRHEPHSSKHLSNISVPRFINQSHGFISREEVLTESKVRKSFLHGYAWCAAEGQPVENGRLITCEPR